MKKLALTELHAMLDEEGVERESSAVMAKWLARGDGVAVYRNEDLGHPELGHRQFVSFGSSSAMLEIQKAEDLPTRLPDIGSAINWRYQLEAVYRPQSQS